MKTRILAVAALLAITILSACDMGSPAATPTPTVEPTPAAVATDTPDMVGTPSAPAPIDEPVPTATTAIVEPTATQAQAAVDEPLQLAAVTVETTDATRVGALEQERTLNVPAGFGVKVFANGLSNVRLMGLSPEGVVYATVRGEGRVVSLPDADKDGVADEAKTFADGLAGVHGIAFRDGAVYVATEGEIIRLQDSDGDGVADKRDVISNDLPTGGGHSSRTLAFGPDGKLYVSAGSSCNVCVEDDPKRAAISRYSADGKFEKVYAKGLRNAVGMILHPITGELWATNNGRDGLGDDVPPEAIYKVKEDTDYGWPYCYGDRVTDKTQNAPAGYCEKTGVPAVNMQAHSAPLGLTFYTGEQFPEQFRGDMYVAFHGSWNRSVPTGYKVVRIRMKENQPDVEAGERLVEDFITGWFLGADAWGRPVDVLTSPNGTMLVTDDKAGAIYTVYYAENAGP